MMRSRSLLSALLLSVAALLVPALGYAQTVLPSVSIGTSSQAMVVNPANNKTYIAQHDAGRVRVINGATGAVTDVDVSFRGAPKVLAINPVDQRVMVGTEQGLVVIDGNTDGIAAQSDLSFASPDITAIAFNAGDSNQFYLLDTPNNIVWEFQDNGGGTEMAINFNLVIPCPTAVAANPITGSAYITNPCADKVTAHTTAFPFGSYIDTGPGSAPVAVAVNPVTNMIYVALAGTQGVDVIDGSSNTVTTTIATGSSAPTAIAVNPATNKIYVAYGDGTVTLIDAGAANATTSIPVGTNPVGITIDNVRNQVYVANQGSGTVSVIDGASNTVTATLTVGASPNLISVNPLTSRVFVASTANSTLTTIDGRTYTHGTITAADSRATAVNPFNRRAYIALGGSPNGSVKVIDEATDSLITTVPVGADPNHIAVDLGLNRIYTSNATDGTVTAINGVGNAVVGTVTVGAGPGAIVVNPLTHKVYVAQPASGNVVVFDGTNLAGGINIAPVGGMPVALAVNVVTNKVYVADGSALASNPIIDGATNAVTQLLGPSPEPPASDIAVNPVTNRIYTARANSSLVEEFNGDTQLLLNNYTVTTPVSLAVNAVTNRVYAATFTPDVQVIDPTQPPASAVTSITLSENTRLVAVDGYADRVVVSGLSRLFTIDGESATESTTLSPAAVLSPGLAAIDSSTGKAYAPVPAGASAVVVKEATPVALQNHGIGNMPGASISSNPNATLSVAVIANNYSPSTPAVLTVNSAQDDLYGGNTASASPGLPFTISLSGLTRGLHFVTLFATDTMAGTSIDTQSGTSGGTSFMIGRPTIFPMLTVDPPSITTTTLAGGTEGIAYSQSVAATGGTGGTTFSITSGALPDSTPGPTLILAADGTISGTPTLAGTYNFTVTATDNTGGSGSAPLSITIAAGTPVLSVTSSLSFGTALLAATTADQNIALSNTGWGVIQVNLATITGTNAGDFAFSTSLNTCDTLAHGQSCVIPVHFTPTAPGSRSALAHVATDYAPMPDAQVTLTGTGLPVSSTLTAAANGTGAGTITSAPAGISCPGDCSEPYTNGTSVTLTATPNASSVFTTWTGCDSTVGNQCTVTVASDRTVTATFTALFTLTAAADGNGTGTIASAPAGVSCPGDCTEPYSPGTIVTLTATPNATSAFAAWTGCDSVTTNQCTVTMNAAHTVTATFTAFVVYNIVLEGFQEVPYVATDGAGSGTATFNPVTGQLSFNISYSGTTNNETGSTLNGPAARGATAASIDPMSSTTTKTDAIHLSPAQQTMLANGQLYVNIATAAFPNGELRGQIDNLGATSVKALSASINGTGNGVVIGSSEAGGIIVCGGLCNANVPDGKVVTFTPNPTSGSIFAGWGGACSGTGACSVTMNAAKNVTATFNLGTGPTTTLTPSAITVVVGANLTLTAALSGASGIPSGDVIFQDGNQPLATVHVDGTGHAVFSTAGLALGSHPLTVKFLGDSNYAAVTSAVVTVNVVTPQAIPRLGAISTRMEVLTGDNVLIGGFIISGSTPKTVVVRARGPSLASSGISNFLANPFLQVVFGDGTVLTNDDWQSAGNAADIVASGFAPADSHESAILVTLQPGPYTAIVSGSGGGTGVGIVEVFEVDHPENPLAGISTRGEVLTGNDVMIGGVIIQGDFPQTVVVRARGPSLASQGVANPLSNPLLQLVASDGTVLTNDDWQSAGNAADIQASGFAPADARESAILVTLQPGAYTAIVSGVGGATGVGIVEVFAVTP